MLKIQNLKSGYNGIEVLQDFDLDIEPAQISVLIGPNGAGKTTVLKSIFGLAEVYSGKIIFKDLNITKLKTFELIELGISYVPQGRLVFSDMTVLENLEMGAYIFRDKEIVRKSINEMFIKFPILEIKKNDNASSLSGGQQQILSIARCLVQNPQLLLLDEPSLGLSPKAIKEVFDIVLKIKEEGVAVLIVEQNVRQVAKIADKIVVLEHGEMAMSGGPEVLNDKKIREIYLGE